MNYPTQKGTLNRLEAETRKAGCRHEDACCAILARAWDACKHDLRAIVLSEYHRGHGREPWTLAGAGPTLERMGHFAMNRLVSFHNAALPMVRRSIADAYRHEALRQAWMLDMLTPPSYKPRLPARALREAAARIPTATWEQALGEWLRAYAANLGTNLRLEALHSGSLTDAADEIDAAKVDGFDPAYKFSSMITNQILSACADARRDVAGENGDIVAEEIFQTLEDSAVCDRCDEEDGKPADDAEPIPVHYNCRCFTRIVPRDFAELLRDGTDEEKQAALDADARGLIPDAMAIRDADGNLQAHITVSFDQWMGEQGLNIYGRAGAAQVR